MFDMMDRLGVPREFITLSRDIYTDSSFRVKTSQGFTNNISQNKGVKQGCPLSPLLLNLAIQGMPLGLDECKAGYNFADGNSLKYLANADDLCIMAHTKKDIQDMIHKLEEFTNWADLQFNNTKCAALSASAERITHPSSQMGREIQILGH